MIEIGVDRAVGEDRVVLRVEGSIDIPVDRLNRTDAAYAELVYAEAKRAFDEAWEQFMGTAVGFYYRHAKR